MNRYMVLVWSKIKRNRKPINIDKEKPLNQNKNWFLTSDNEIWVVVSAPNSEEAAQKAKVLFELSK